MILPDEGLAMEKGGRRRRKKAEGVNEEKGRRETKEREEGRQRKGKKLGGLRR